MTIEKEDGGRNNGDVKVLTVKGDLGMDLVLIWDAKYVCDLYYKDLCHFSQQWFSFGQLIVVH